MAEFYVLIIEDKTEKVIKRMGPMGEAKAVKVENGANINLDHDNYTTEIEEVDCDE